MRSRAPANSTGKRPSRNCPGYRPDLSPAPKEYAQALELIHNSKRPVILAGHGIIISGAMREVRDFAERAGIPVAMTLLGLGAFPASHPLNLGMMGMHGEAWVNHTIQEADLLLAFGMRFDDRVTGNLKNYAPNAKKIHIEIDPAEINKNVKVDVPLVGDLREVLLELMPKVESIDRSEWLDSIDKLKGDSAVRDIQNLPDSGHLYAAHVINDLWRQTRDGNTIVVTDVGQHQMWEAQYYKHEHPRSLITSGGLGTMGFALPAAIGAKVACPEAEVWVMVGDGGFQMTMCELATIVQENLKIHIAIINNGFLGMVRQWQEFFYDRNYAATPLLNPDFAQVGGGLWHPQRDGVGAFRGCAHGASGAAARRADADQFQGGTGRHGLSDGRGGGGAARHDPAAESDRGDGGRRVECALRSLNH